ncbi:MAG: hypothetical protein RLZZ522_17 [Verrucomicrobiota bacterium]
MALLQCNDLQECLITLLTTALRLPGFDCGGAYLCDEATGGLRLISHHGFSPAFVERTAWRPADSPLASLARAGAIVYALRDERPPEVAAVLAAEGIEAIAILPLQAHGRAVGSLNLGSHCHPQIQPGARIALESVVALAAAAIGHLLERQARQSAEWQLRLAVEGAEFGTWFLDLDSNAVVASAKYRALHGFGPDESLTLASIQSAIHPADRDGLQTSMQQAIHQDVPVLGEYRTLDGSRWIGFTTRFYGDHGRHLYGFARDCTSLKEAEAAQRDAHEELEMRVGQRTAELAAANAAMQEQSARLEMVLEGSHAGTWELDLTTGGLQWDARSRQIFGLEEGAPISHEWCVHERIHPADRERLERRIAATLTGETDAVWNHEFRILHPTLGECWILGLGRIERDATGQAQRMAGLNFDITERKRREYALSQSEEKYRKLHQSMREAFVRTDMAGRILESNRAFRDLLGYTAEELSHLTCPEFTPPQWHAFQQRLLEEELLTRDYTEVFEKEYICKDGTVLPVELRVFLIRDAAGQPDSMWAIVRDVSERKATEVITRQWHQTLEQRLGERAQQLIQSEARFRQLAEATFEGIVISENGIILDANPQLAAMFGCDMAEILGRHLADLVATESRTAFYELLGENGEEPYEWLGQRQDGSHFPVRVNPRIRTWQGRTVRIAALRDLTETKLAAAKAMAQQTELEHAQRLAMVSEVSAGILHQISQPICSLDANLAWAKVKPEACEMQHPKAVEFIGEIQEDVTRIREIVIHLRSLANPERPIYAPIRFPAVIADVLPLLQREASSRSLRLETALATDLPPLLGDAVQLKQVVLNLVRNAFDACADSPPEQRTVLITTRVVPDQGLELTVRDTGSGIDPAVAHRLFEPFFTTKKTGHGIGLRLSRTIIRAHRGSIEAANNPDGIGAVFRVFLHTDLSQNYTKV